MSVTAGMQATRLLSQFPWIACRFDACSGLPAKVEARVVYARRGACRLPRQRGNGSPALDEVLARFRVSARLLR